MNLKQINEFRVAHGLAPLAPPANPKSSGNKAAHAQACRDLKAKRNSGKK